MSELIRQRKMMAGGDGLMDDVTIANPFAQVNGSGIPRGELKDSQRKAGKAEKYNDNDGDRDY